MFSGLGIFPGGGLSVFFNFDNDESICASFSLTSGDIFEDDDDDDAEEEEEDIGDVEVCIDIEGGKLSPF
jgi:hypothetical protein